MKSLTELVVVFADNWGTEGGGINSFNLDLVKSIDSYLSTITLEDIKVICVTNKTEVLTNSNAILINGYEKSGYMVNFFKILERLSFVLKLSIEEVKEQFKFSWWVGHDVITGEHAISLCKEYNALFKKSSRFALIHHMVYEDYYGLKQDLPISEEVQKEKFDKQKDLLRRADMVFGVGPKLTRHANEYARQNAVELIPGLQDLNKRHRPGVGSKRTFTATLVGRLDAKDDAIKQSSLALEALEDFFMQHKDTLTPESKVNLIGVEEKDAERLTKVQFHTYRGRDHVYEYLVKSNIGFLPSSHDGFGLVGWEFISAGIPLVISQNTGLYEFLDSFIRDSDLVDAIYLLDLNLTPNHNIFLDDSEDAIAEKNTIIKNLNFKINEVYNRFAFFNKQAEILKEELLKKGYTWERTVGDFLGGLGYRVNISSLENYVAKAQNPYGIVKIIDTNVQRIEDYKTCLYEARGHIFISGTSMIHLSSDSKGLILEKAKTNNISLLLLDPDWIDQYHDILSFRNSFEKSEDFSSEIRNSINRLKAVKANLGDLGNNITIKTYKTIFPYIITGYDKTNYGKMVFEITDYVPSEHRPRFTVYKTENEESLYTQVYSKFFELWENEILTSEVR